jgi:hypothetical protein
LDTAQRRLDLDPEKMAFRRCTAEHPFGTLKSWMGATHFLTRTMERVSAEMSLHVLAYNMKGMIKIMGIGQLLKAIRAHGEALMAFLVAAVASIGRIGQLLEPIRKEVERKQSVMASMFCQEPGSHDRCGLLSLERTMSV